MGVSTIRRASVGRQVELGCLLSGQTAMVVNRGSFCTLFIEIAPSRRFRVGRPDSGNSHVIRYSSGRSMGSPLHSWTSQVTERGSHSAKVLCSEPRTESCCGSSTRPATNRPSQFPTGQSRSA